MSTSRAQNVQTLLPNGKVLVTGGLNDQIVGGGEVLEPIITAELYDPASNSWSSAGSMSTPRVGHTATLLGNGLVLVVGGESGSAVTNNVDLYNPSTNSWAPAAPLHTAREFHSATLLANGKVLVTGGSGFAFTTVFSSTELYDPASNSWTVVAPLPAALTEHFATLLPSGDVLVGGGLSASLGAPVTAELYNPATNVWTGTGSLISPSVSAAIPLANGQVAELAAIASQNEVFVVFEFYTPATGTWRISASGGVDQGASHAVLLGNGQLLVDDEFGNTQVYDPASDSWTPGASMTINLLSPPMTLLPNGKVLAAGGSGGEATDIGEIYTPSGAPIAGPVSVTVAANSSNDPIKPNLSGGQTFVVAIATPAAHGTATASGMALSYTPNPGFAGADSFTYIAENGLGNSAPATVSITVTPPTITLTPATLPNPQVGVAYSQTITAAGGTAPFHFAISAGALPAGLTLSGTTGAITGTPTVAGPDSFTVTATDSSSGSGPFVGSVTYSVTVAASALPPPTVSPVSVTTACNTPVSINLASAIAGSGITAVTIAAGPSHGTASVNGEIVAYTPAAGFCGNSDSFSYTATNAAGTSAPAIVAVTISPQLSPFAPAIAYVANFGDGTVSAIDTATGAVTATIPVGSGPDAVVVTPDGSRAFVGNFTANQLTVVSTATNNVIHAIPVGLQPYGLAMSPDGMTVYVANFGDGTVSVVSTATASVTKTIQIGTNTAPRGIAISPNGATVYVADSNNGQVSVINTATATVTGTITTGGTDSVPFAVAFSPDGTRAYVANNGVASVSVINTAAASSVATIAVGPLPSELAVSPDGKTLYVANSNELANPDTGTVSVIATATNQLVATIPVGRGPDGLAITPDGSQVIVANTDSNNVSIIATAGNTVTTIVPVGSFPHGRSAFVGPGISGAMVASPLLASVLPGGRSVDGGSAAVFATVLNTAAVSVNGCQISLPSGAPAGLSLRYQTTNPATNGLIGQPNTPASIASGGFQTFFLGFSATAPLSVTDQPLTFSCTDVAAAPVTSGVNTIDLTFSSTPVPDIVALAATQTNDGTVHVVTGGAGAFAVATVNLGTTAALLVEADTGSATLPVTLSLCQTNPANGTCLAAPAASVSVMDAANATPTFSIFVTANHAVPFAPGTSRVFVRFKDAAGAAHGSTSVAVLAQ